VMAVGMDSTLGIDDQKSFSKMMFEKWV
jgi:hypothetical protein